MSATPRAGTATRSTDDLNRDVYIFTNLVATRFAADVERLCREEELTEAHYRILWVLCLSGSRSGLTMGEIVDGLVNKAADATRLVDKLERQGLVTRVPSESDRRKVIVTVSAAGRRVFSRLTPKIKNLHIGQMEGLSSPEKLQLVSLLNKALWGYSRD